MKKFFTNPFTYLAAAVVLAFIFRDKIASLWKTDKPADKPAPPAEGSACSLNGQAGTIVNGACVPVVSAPRFILVPIRTTRVGRRWLKCYSHNGAASCSQRIYEPAYGWGTLYSTNGTQCCYIF
jgi:hypothetical protein